MFKALSACTPALLPVPVTRCGIHRLSLHEFLPCLQGHYGYPITGIYPSVVALPVVPIECEQLFYYEGSEKETLEKVPPVGELQAFYNAVTEARRLRREGGTDTYGVLVGVTPWAQTRRQPARVTERCAGGAGRCARGALPFAVS